MITNRAPILKLALQTNSNIFATQKRNSLYNKYKHGPQKISNPDPPIKEWAYELLTKEGRENYKREVSAAIRQPFQAKNFWKRAQPNKLDIFEDFGSDDAIKRWKPVADGDSLNGFSESNIIRSPAGHGLFTGIIDNRLPDDGMTQNSGFAGIIGPPAPKSSLFNFQPVWDWQQYNCIEIKFRGDGRKYGLVINTGDYMDDISYYDYYFFPIYTRGGPYWQTLRVPFYKFVFAYKGFIQDVQGYLPFNRVKFVAITLEDKVDGPFSLEIDHLGLVLETRPLTTLTSYETYTFNHIKYKHVGVDCPVPESSP